MGITARAKALMRTVRCNGISKKYQKLEEQHWRAVSRDIAPPSMRNRPAYLQFGDTLIKYLSGRGNPSWRKGTSEES